MRIYLARAGRGPSADKEPDTAYLPGDGSLTEPVVWDTKGDLEEDPLPASVLISRYPGVVPGRWYTLDEFKRLCRQPEVIEAEVWTDVGLRVALPDRDRWVELRCRQADVVDSVVSEVLAFAEATRDGSEWRIRVE